MLAEQGLLDTWLSSENKKTEAAVGTAAALHKLNSIKARLRNARSEVYCTLQVSHPFKCLVIYFLSFPLTLPLLQPCTSCVHLLDS